MEEPTLHPIALHVHHFYSCMIVASVMSTVLGSMDKYRDDDALLAVELTFNVIFSFEALARVFCAPQKKVLFSSMYMWMDILAVVPFYVILLGQVDDQGNPAIELLVLLVPILRLLKVTRHSPGWRLLVISMRQSSTQLMVPFFLLMLMVVFSSSVLFWIEKHSDSEDGPAFESIPQAMWFAIVTISTVGFGDISPNSASGKAATSGLILLGVCYMAMPLVIVGNTFSQVWQDREKILIAEKTKAKFAHGAVTSDLVHDLFNDTDADGSGTVSRSEFISLMLAFNLGFTRAQIKELFRALDQDRSGQISFKEFQEFLFPETTGNDDAPEGEEELDVMSPKIESGKKINHELAQCVEHLENAMRTQVDQLRNELLAELRAIRNGPNGSLQGPEPQLSCPQSQIA
jgi:hypothetical protein